MMIQFQRKIKGRVITVQTHAGMHADEMFALFQIERLATEDFLDRYCADGHLALGVGGKDFDPHTVVPGKSLRPEDCCASLVAQALGVSSAVMVSGFLRFFQNRKRFHGGSAFDLAHLVGVMLAHGDDIVSILAWAFLGFEAKIRGPGAPVRPGASIDLRLRGQALRLQSYGGLDFYTVALLFLLERFAPDPIAQHVPAGRMTIDRNTLARLAKQLNVDKKLELRLILQTAQRPDGHPFGLPVLIRDLYQSGRPPQRIVDWGIAGLGAKLDEQQQFFGPTRHEFEHGIHIEVIPGPRGMPVRKGIILSDNPQVAQYARSRFGGNIDVLIQMRSSGHVYIATRFESGIKLHRVAYLLSLAEQQATGGIRDDDWDHLTAPTLLPDQRWFFQHTPQALFNGTLTLDIEVPPTSLALSEIDRLVKAGLRPPQTP